MERFARTRLLVGDEGLARLEQAHVAVVGLGGVGSYALEALARAGVGRLTLIDHDAVAVSNINRQLLALDSTVGQPKVDAARARVAGINPGAVVETRAVFVEPDNVADIVPEDAGYAVDAIDSVNSKVHLLMHLLERDLEFVSCMGSGGKFEPVGVNVADISATRFCPLARRVRQRLKRCGVFRGVRCVYTEEAAQEPSEAPESEDEEHAKRVHGTLSFLPGILGLTAAGLIIKDILRSG